MNTRPSDPAQQELIERVVGWHNRHWFATRIDASHVTGLGVVALPFDEAPDTARRWRPPARRFDQPLIAPLRAAQIARFAWRHGSTQRCGPPEWPLREVAPVGSNEAPLQWRHLQTAAIELGTHRLRVLIGADGTGSARLLGARFWNRRRWAFGSSLGGLALALGTAIVIWLATSDLQDARSSTQPIAVSVTATPIPEPVVEPPPETPSAAASGALPSAAVEVDTEVEGAESASIETPASASARTPAEPRADSTVYALATAATRNRAGSQLRVMLMNAPSEPRAGRAHAEVMHMEAGWRVVLWPFTTREQAEQVRATLARRGVRVELITF